MNPIQIVWTTTLVFARIITKSAIRRNRECVVGYVNANKHDGIKRALKLSQNRGRKMGSSCLS
jgi:hypothetical protein